MIIDIVKQHSEYVDFKYLVEEILEDHKLLPILEFVPFKYLENIHEFRCTNSDEIHSLEHISYFRNLVKLVCDNCGMKSLKGIDNLVSFFIVFKKSFNF